VDQVSRPVLAALVAVIGFAGVWLTVLRPKPESQSSGAPAPVAAQAAPAPATAAPTQAAAKPAPAPEPAARAQGSAEPAVNAAADPSAPILRDLEKGKTAVLLFWNPVGEDDRAALAAVGKTDRRGGRVTVRFANIDDVAKYEAITRGVDVLQPPTTLVIGPDRKARTIVGYTEAREIDQLVGDVRAGR
jgi:hypothetical protein